MEAIVTQGLSKSYGEIVAISNLNVVFHVRFSSSLGLHGDQESPYEVTRYSLFAKVLPALPMKKLKKAKLMMIE